MTHFMSIVKRCLTISRCHDILVFVVLEPFVWGWPSLSLEEAIVDKLHMV